MAKQIYSNFASALLAASIDDNDLTIQVASGFGALFPSPGATEFFLVALENASGDREIVKIESRSSDLLTVSARGQEGTTAQSWTNGLTRVECRATKGTLDRFIQRDGDSMDGDLDMGGNEIADARLTGDTTVVAGQLVGTKIRGTEDDASNEIEVPSDGTRATAGGARILVEGDSEGASETVFTPRMAMLWYGAVGDVPDGWAICDGSTVNGIPTPDMRGLFAIGANLTTYTLGTTGGAATDTTDSAGAHSHVASSGPHVLTEAELPAHRHNEISYGLTVGAGTQAPAIQTAGAVTGTAQSELTGGDQPHSHEDGVTDEQGAHTHEVDIIPPYRAWHFIMYVGF